VSAGKEPRGLPTALQVSLELRERAWITTSWLNFRILFLAFMAKEEPTMSIEERVQALEGRVRLLEDELAIQRLIVFYGLATDAGDGERSSSVFAPEAVYDTDVLVMNGRDDVRDMIHGPRHQGMVGRCAHQIGPAVVRIDGERAEALGYSTVYLRSGDEVGVYRVSFNRWELRKRDGAWRIVRRTTRLLGHEEGLLVLRGALPSLTVETAA
jgi:hypothetical protein